MFDRFPPSPSRHFFRLCRRPCPVRFVVVGTITRTTGNRLVVLGLKGLGLGVGQGKELGQGLLDDADTVHELGLGDAQRRGEADDVLVGGLGEETLVLEQEAQLPGSAAVGLALVNDNGVQQTAATGKGEGGVLDLGDGGAELLTEDGGLLDKVLLLDDLEGSDGDSASEGVTTVGGAVLTGLDAEHDVVVGKDGRDGVNTTGQGLTEKENIGLDIVVVNAEQLACAGKTGLDLVGDHEDVVLLAELRDLLEVSLVGNHDTSFTLDGLDQEGGDVLAVVLEDVLEVLDVVVADGAAGLGVDGTDVGEVGAEANAGIGVGGHGDDTDSTSVEVLRAGKNNSLVLWDALLHVAPLAGELDGGLDGLGTGVHGEDLVEAKILGDVLGILAKDIVVEGAGAETELLGLVTEGLDDLGVGVAYLVMGRYKIKKR